ncbi:MAG TPA: hypothetical protein PKL29_00410, partial [Methanothrix sp.]|nr:hypothetical protein [Methanothrix sp.]
LDAGKPADVLHIFPGDHVIPRINKSELASFASMYPNQAKFMRYSDSQIYTAGNHLIRYKGSFMGLS